MDIQELANHFILHSPAFHDDLSIENLDDKHQHIVTMAYEKKNAVSELNFRNWEGQMDLLSPVQINNETIRKKGFIKTIYAYLYAKSFNGFAESCARSTLLDDVEILSQLNAKSLLRDNSVLDTPGATKFFKYDGMIFNQRWLRYIYLLKKINDLKVLLNGGLWVDIGSYYGGLQGLVKKYNPKATIVLLDFHHQLCRSYIYLSNLYPDANHILPDKIDEYVGLKDIPAGSIMYVPVSQFQKIKHGVADLVTNFFSLGEMRREHFNTYMNSELLKNSGIIYLVNRFVSAPYFEKTYDTDITITDYLYEGRRMSYFDVFPIHHYQLSNRKILKRKFWRNTSSPYFELITKNI